MFKENYIVHGEGSWFSHQIIPKKAFHIGQVLIKICGLNHLFFF